MKPNLPLIKAVLQLPTAPFHEGAVSEFIRDFCRKLGVPCRQDSYGNLKIVYRKGAGRSPLGRSPFVLSAHMDHPGFEVVRGGARPIVQLLGGVPDRFFGKAKVVVWEDGRAIKAKVARIINKKKRQYQLTPHPSLSHPPSPRLRRASKGRGFGYFDLPAAHIRNQIVHTKAADDLINVACLLNFLQALVRKKIKTHVIFLFTRAEEVGFLGTLGVTQQQFVPPKIPVIVLEASNAKAGNVKIGGGPVLRVGDRASTFSHPIDLWLQEAAQGLKTQRALLAGGRCEATVFVSKGYQAGCLALPLGNYHNIGSKSYAMEYISLKDYQTLLRWLLKLTQANPPAQVVQTRKNELNQLFQSYRKKLKDSSHC